MVTINASDLTVDAIVIFIFCREILNRNTLLTKNRATRKGHLSTV